MGVTERTVQSRWAGGLRADVTAGEYKIVVDEPESVGGTGLGPQPTELLLASLASCFTIALAFCARKRGVELEDVNVAVTGRYDGPRFVAFRIAVRASGPDDHELTTLVRAAERVCYVTRTLASAPTVEVVLE